MANKEKSDSLSKHYYSKIRYLKSYYLNFVKKKIMFYIKGLN